LTIKKRSDGGGAAPVKKRITTKRTVSGTPTPKRAVPRAKAGAKPRIRASHGRAPDALGSRSDRLTPALKAARGAPIRKPLAGPKRSAPRRPVAPTIHVSPEASAASRELALALASAGLDKKAIGIEILDVTGKVDYADFLVVMTGRSDRHVHSIATGIEEAMRRRKIAPLSMEGLGAASWVLIDFADVVVHVFLEEARALYDIEGLWIDAGRVPVPAEGPPRPEGSPAEPV
jgi:ribosome-associated protein